MRKMSAPIEPRTLYTVRSWHIDDDTIAMLTYWSIDKPY